MIMDAQNRLYKFQNAAIEISYKSDINETKMLDICDIQLSTVEEIMLVRRLNYKTTDVSKMDLLAGLECSLKANGF